VNRIADREVDCHAAPHRSTGWGRGGTLVMMAALCIACLLFASSASAQCAARDTLQNQLRLRKAPSATAPQVRINSALDVPVWKTITLGTFRDPLSLVNALDAAGCGVGDSAGQILARPAFSVSATAKEVNLVAVSAAELGFRTDTISLADIYARAQQLGFGLAAAEIAPQLRLQYPDQPMGEFLTVGMEPIKTWKGDPVILSVANGGAGLILIGQDGGPDAHVSVISRFVFVRPNEAMPVSGVGKAAPLIGRSLP